MKGKYLLTILAKLVEGMNQNAPRISKIDTLTQFTIILRCKPYFNKKSKRKNWKTTYICLLEEGIKF